MARDPLGALGVERFEDVANGEHAEPQFTWRAHPARERPAHAVGAGLAIAILGCAVGAVMQDLGWGALAVLFLVVSLNRFFFPSSFAIDALGVSARYPLRRQRFLWKNLRRFQRDSRGGYLSSQAQPSRLDAYRGMHLLFGDQRSAVIRRIEAELPTRGSR